MENKLNEYNSELTKFKLMRELINEMQNKRILIELSNAIDDRLHEIDKEFKKEEYWRN